MTAFRSSFTIERLIVSRLYCSLSIESYVTTWSHKQAHIFLHYTAKFQCKPGGRHVGQEEVPRQSPDRAWQTYFLTPKQFFYFYSQVLNYIRYVLKFLVNMHVTTIKKLSMVSLSSTDNQNVYTL